MQNAGPSSWVLLALLAAVASACQREPPELRRPWAEAPDLEAVTLDGTTVRARRFGPEARLHTVALGPARPGEVSFQAAVEGAPTARASLMLAGTAEARRCSIEGPHWRPCRLAIPGATPNLQLQIRLEGDGDARVALSAPLLRSGPPSRALVIVILTDTLRADCLTTYRPHVPLGTSLDRFAHDAVTFEHLRSSSSWTRTAVTTLLTGLDASTHNVLERDDVLPPGLDGLPLVMQRAGYRTIAWSTNPNILPIWGFDAGFDVFHDFGGSAWPQEKVHAGAVLGAVRDWLAEGDSLPAFLYVHLMDPHAPYRPQPPDLAAVTGDAGLMATFPGAPSSPAILAEYARYLAEIRGMDRELGAFFGALRTHGLYEGAAILVLADHGEEFLDHGDTRHGKTLYEEMLHVPVMMKLPGNMLAGTRITADLGLADIAPTLLGALGLEGLPPTDGRDLWDRDTSLVRNESATQSALLKIDTYHQAAVVQEHRKLILDYHAGEQLFDLQRDPQEHRNLLPAAEVEAVALRSILDTRMARHAAGWHVRVCGGDRTERRQLRIQVRGDAHGALLENGDAVRLIERGKTASVYEADFELAPRPSERVVEGKVWKGMRADEDDVLVSAPDADLLVVTSVAGTPLRYGAGMAAEGPAAAEVTAHASDPVTRVRPSDPVECRSQPATVAAMSGGHSELYVRVWYVAPSEHLDATRIDPALQDRLRALGYQR